MRDYLLASTRREGGINLVNFTLIFILKEVINPFLKIAQEKKKEDSPGKREGVLE